jgi:hypothetical protein
MGIFSINNSIINPNIYPYGYKNTKTITYENYGKIIDPFFDNVSLLITFDSTNWINDLSSVTKTTTQKNYIMDYDNFGVFNGINSYIEISNHDDLKFGTGDFTLECWVRLPFYKGGDWSNDGAIFGPKSSDGTLFFYIGHDNGRMDTWDGSTSANQKLYVGLDEWTHIVWERKSGNLYGFLNGEKGNTTSYTNSISSTGIFTIGGYVHNSNNRYFGGYIKDFRITKGVARYENSFDVPGPLINTIPS